MRIIDLCSFNSRCEHGFANKNWFSAQLLRMQTFHYRITKISHEKQYFRKQFAAVPSEMPESSLKFGKESSNLTNKLEAISHICGNQFWT